MFTFYRLILSPLAWLIFQSGRLFGDAKWKTLLRAKNSGEFRLAPGWTEETLRAARPFWFHAASGEIEYARPVLRELKKRHPGVPLLVTYSSPSALRIIEKLTEVDAVGAVPWEFRGEVREFLNRFSPRAALFARTDLWPVLADTLRAEKIPALLFSATFAANSSRLRGPARALTGRSLRALDSVQVVSPDDVENLGDLARGLKIEVGGDTRFDQVFHRLSHPQPLPESLRPSGAKVFVAGSTWPEDEAVLLPAFAAATGWKFVIAPHEIGPGKIENLERRLRELGLDSQRFTAGGAWTAKVLLLDRVGLLAEIYAWAGAAFVGGSFRKQVHSVMEPLAAGCRVLVGPKHLNNRESLDFAAEFAGEYPAVMTVHDSAELGALLNEEGLIGARDEIRTLVAARGGATERVVVWCERFVE